MDKPVAVQKLLELIREFLFYMPAERLTIGRSRVIRAGLDPYDADLAFGYLQKIEVISDYKKSEAIPLEIYEEVYDERPIGRDDIETDYYHVFSVDVNMLRAHDPKSLITDGKVPTLFLESESSLQIGNITVSLPPFKNEFYFCRVIFMKSVNERIDWSLVYEEMEGKEATFSETNSKERRKVYDTCLAINQRIEQATGIKNFFIWETKTIRRRM